MERIVIYNVLNNGKVETNVGDVYNALLESLKADILIVAKRRNSMKLLRDVADINSNYIDTLENSYYDVDAFRDAIVMAIYNVMALHHRVEEIEIGYISEDTSQRLDLFRDAVRNISLDELI